ncbi:MAG: hypothetical protein LQ350_004913 [Teloschistes chrysophthalmus]|nr:MAG: hypothetical protein LQ350_004913 [Niorma chrysophthalma]
MDQLPAELILQIAYYLDAFDIVKFHLLSKRLRQITRDVEFWRQLCFEDSNSAATQKRRDLQFIAPSLYRQQARVFELQRRARALSAHSGFGSNDGEASNGNQKHRAAIANWDPSFSSEKVDWYDEYIARHAPISMSWLQQPASKDSGAPLEIKGLGVYERYGSDSLAVAPLDDGSMSIWNIGRQDEPWSGSRGTVAARSKPGLLSLPTHGQSKHAHGVRVATSWDGIVEGISIDKIRNKTYFAKDNDLFEVDLETLQVSSYERYPFPITALSEAAHPVPLTVATADSLHLHDPREPSTVHLPQDDQTATLPPSLDSRNDFYRLRCGDYYSRKKAPLHDSGSLSITHLHDSLNGHICVAGRFPSILTYNRRMFPRLASAVYSGSRLSSITSLPLPILQPRTSPLSDPTTAAAHTLIACGEYNGKGTLELYPFYTSTSSSTPSMSNNPVETPPYKNRVSASSSKLLSVTPHGTRLVFSDIDGGLKWVERDGQSLVRRWNINAYTASVTSPHNHSFAPRSPFEEIDGDGSDDGDGDAAQDGGCVARKLLPVGACADSRGEVAVWTGEKVGILGFRPRPRWELEQGPVERGEEGRGGRGGGGAERVYQQRMRYALERQADEVRWMTGLGFGV